VCSCSWFGDAFEYYVMGRLAWVASPYLGTIQYWYESWINSTISFFNFFSDSIFPGQGFFPLSLCLNFPFSPKYVRSAASLFSHLIICNLHLALELILLSSIPLLFSYLRDTTEEELETSFLNSITLQYHSRSDPGVFYRELVVANRRTQIYAYNFLETGPCPILPLIQLASCHRDLLFLCV